MRCDVVVGLGFGDEGKGGIVDYLTRKQGAKLVVRFNGGPQAGHHVVEEGGRWHCFSQFGSGTFISGVRTHLSFQMLIKPASLLEEATCLIKRGVDDALSRLSIDPRCHIITPYHAMIEQMLEASRGKDGFGTVGTGIGQAVLDWEKKGEDALVLADFLNDRLLRHKLQPLWREKREEGQQILGQFPKPKVKGVWQRFQGEEYEPTSLYQEYQRFITEAWRCLRGDVLRDCADITGETVILEGAQGALLDYQRGFIPYVTKTETTLPAAERWLNGWPKQVTRIGVVRSYATRHGPGPFVTEDKRLTMRLPESHNGNLTWVGKFRVGWSDLVASRYALALNGRLDFLALTNLDRLSGFKRIRVCIAYEYLGSKNDLLDRYFQWGGFGQDRVRITALKVPFPTERQNAQLANLLFDCRPLEFIEFKGWQEDISGVRERDGLPKAAQDYVRFLESKQGLGVPIGIISVGPTALHKF